MRKTITRTIPEQQELMKEFEDPVDFILTYVSVYEKQQESSTKVLLHQIPYYSKFECSFLEKILHTASEKPLDQIEFGCIEEVLAYFRSKPFYDIKFYNCCILSLFKGINIVLNRVESEILGYNFDNAYLLYKYTMFEVDLREPLAKQVYNTDGRNNESYSSITKEKILRLKEQIDLLNPRIENVRPLEIISKIKHEGEEENTIKTDISEKEDLCPQDLVKIILPSEFIGEKRVLKYELNSILDIVSNKIIKMHDKENIDSVYLLIMTMCNLFSEIDENLEVIDRLKLKASKLIENTQLN